MKRAILRLGFLSVRSPGFGRWQCIGGVLKLRHVARRNGQRMMDNPLAEPSGVSPADGQLPPPRHPGVAREQGCEYDNDVRPRSQPE